MKVSFLAMLLIVSTYAWFTSKVYVILADYLPNSTGHATNAGLSIGSYVYSVYATTASNLISGLTHETAWDTLANGVSTEVAGSPSADLLMLSYNNRNGTTLDYEDMPELSSSAVDYDLYVPHTSSVNSCYGYWLTSASDTGVRCVLFNNYVSHDTCSNTEMAARPVVVLSTGISITQENGVWKVE